jgi:hypothetical protein
MREQEGGVWGYVHSKQQIVCEVDPASGFAELTFLGAPMEVNLGMDLETLRRCRAAMDAAIGGARPAE